LETGRDRPPRRFAQKIAQAYIDDYYEVWQQEGINALIACAKKKPDKFIMVVAHLIPQH
jgi:hypothetical protein